MRLVREWNVLPFHLLSTLMCSWSQNDSYLLTVITVLSFSLFVGPLLLVFFCNQEGFFLFLQAEYFPANKLVLTLLYKCILSFISFPPTLSWGRDLLWQQKWRLQIMPRKAKTTRSSVGPSSSKKVPHAHPLGRVLFGRPPSLIISLVVVRAFFIIIIFSSLLPIWKNRSIGILVTCWSLYNRRNS